MRYQGANSDRIIAASVFLLGGHNITRNIRLIGNTDSLKRSNQGADALRGAHVFFPLLGELGNHTSPKAVARSTNTEFQG